MSGAFRAGLARYFDAGQLERLNQAVIGIAGVGGLGSNCAVLLARCGVGGFALVDDDFVEASNLNRQHYWPDQVGMPKVAALAAELARLNAGLRLETRQERLGPDNLAAILPCADIWVEALDGPAAKKMFVEAALLAGRSVAAASGICGYGGEPLQKRRLGRLTVVGDFRTGLCDAPPLAPRVAQAAALLADCVLELVLGRA